MVIYQSYALGFTKSRGGAREQYNNAITVLYEQGCRNTNVSSSVSIVNIPFGQILAKVGEKKNATILERYVGAL